MPAVPLDVQRTAAIRALLIAVARRQLDFVATASAGQLVVAGAVHDARSCHGSVCALECTFSAICRLESTFSAAEERMDPGPGMRSIKSQDLSSRERPSAFHVLWLSCSKYRPAGAKIGSTVTSCPERMRQTPVNSPGGLDCTAQSRLILRLPRRSRIPRGCRILCIPSGT